MPFRHGRYVGAECCRTRAARLGFAALSTQGEHRERGNRWNGSHGCGHRHASARTGARGYRLEPYPGKTAPLVAAGAKAAASPAALAVASEAIITILTDAAAIDAAYNGPSGLLAGDVKGKLFIEMSTVRPETERALAEKVRAKGAALVECPVGGSTGPAKEGKLFGFAGGDATPISRARSRCSSRCAGGSSTSARSAPARA